jgi:hypothetical protein
MDITGTVKGQTSAIFWSFLATPISMLADSLRGVKTGPSAGSKGLCYARYTATNTALA